MLVDFGLELTVSSFLAFQNGVQMLIVTKHAFFALGISFLEGMELHYFRFSDLLSKFDLQFVIPCM